MGQDDSNTRRPSSLFERLTQGEDPLFNQIDRNAKSLLQSALSRLDVVSREEFDAQTAVLQRTRGAPRGTREADRDARPNS